MNQVLLLTDGLFHPPLFARLCLQHALSAMTEFSFTPCQSFEQLPEDLDTYSAMVVYLHHKRISTTALEKFDSFVSKGGGLLALHSATASFKQEPHYFEILGGRFTGHGPVKQFTVTPDEHQTLCHSIPAFSIVDEIYIHECHPEVKVQFTTNFKGEKIPMAWTHSYGKGRVFYAVPGHRTQTLKNPALQLLLQEALTWVSKTEKN